MIVNPSKKLNFLLTRLLLFLREKSPYILFPLRIPLSQMETIANIWPAHEEAITSHRFLGSLWFGSAERVGVPQSPIHACESAPPPHVSGKPNWIRMLLLLSDMWTSSLAPQCQEVLHASHISETSRSLSSSRKNLQLIMPHRLL